MTNLRPYQIKARQDIYDVWRAGHRAVMLQLITGGGKTVIFVEIIRDFLKAGKRVILVAHREELITQAWNTLYRREIMAGIIKSGHAENFGQPCQVASIQTICRRKRLPHADLVILDEAHHTQDDNSYGDVLQAHFPYARVLGVTATPYRLSGDGFTTIFNKLVQGPSFQSLVAEGYLSPLRYFVSYNPDLSRAKVKGGDYVSDDIHKAMGMAPIVQSYMDHCAGMSGLVFAVNVTHSEEIVRQYMTAGIPAAHVDANTPPDMRRRLFQALKDKEIRILSNVGIATEGTDIPSCDFVQLARPTKSLSLFLQMIGRVTRAHPGKEFGYVLDNGGLYLEHGLPDRPIDWESHFNGRDKRKQAKASEMIEIELVAEDDQGGRVVSKKPEEVEGLKLIEIRELARERIPNLKSLKEFDRNYAIFQNIQNIKRPGQTAFFKYLQYCNTHSFLMNDQVWSYLIDKLVKEPGEKEARERRTFEEAVASLRSLAKSEYEADVMISTAAKLHEQRLDKIQKSSMPLGFLMKQKSLYLQSLNQKSEPINALPH